MSEEKKNNIVWHNIVRQDDLRKAQRRVLKYMSASLLASFGPAGSDTMICKGNDGVTYTKDGRSIAERLQFPNIIDKTCCASVVDVAVKSDKEVGDGTTSAIMMTCEVFDKLCDANINLDPYTIRRYFNNVCSEIIEEIKSRAIAFTPNLAYKIAYTSTNGNADFAEIIKKIYMDYGNDASINVEISTDEKDHIKTYDGMTLQAGFSDSTYVNTAKNTCELQNPKIYTFKDHVDTPAMCKLFSTIIEKNIVNPMSSNKFNEMIPTVIIAPVLGVDIQSSIEQIAGYINTLKQNGIVVPLLIVTNFYDAIGTYDDIAKMCGCRMIKKYSDMKVYEMDKSKGLAPSEDTIVDFCGSADMVIADSSVTRFINPYKMYVEGSRDEYSAEYKSLVKWLEDEINNEVVLNNTSNDTGNYSRRLASLKSNLVDLFIGGSSINDRDQSMALIKDAVKNCRSASRYGIGYGANFEGLRASYKIMNKYANDTDKIGNIKGKIAKVIYTSYVEVIKKLYNSAGYDATDEFIDNMIKDDCPWDIREDAPARDIDMDPTVATSIMTDAIITESIGKLVVLMFGCNQLLTPEATNNNYVLNFQID